MALDASDKDYLTVLPTKAMTNFLEAMQRCSYELFQADVEAGYLQGGSFKSKSGVYQEFEFKPAKKSLFGLQEVEVSFVPTETVTHALLELDRRFASDAYLSMTWDNDTSVEQLVDEIKRLIGND